MATALSGAEALLRGLRAMGVERIFASPGSDWAPVWEALAAPRAAADFPHASFRSKSITSPRSGWTSGSPL